MASKQLSIRIPVELWDRSAKLAEHMNKRPEYAGHQLSTSRALVMAMHGGLNELEARYKPKRKKARKR